MMARAKVPGITIDDRSTWDIDDAIWVEEAAGGFNVLISISDVAKRAPSGSELGRYAEERVETQYFRSGNSPMLPRHLSEDALSLWPNAPKKTLTVKVELAPDLTIASVDVFRSTLRSRARLTYDEIPELLGCEGPHCAVLQYAKKLADGLLAKRRANGAMVLYDLNVGWVTTEEGHVRQLAKREDTVGYVTTAGLVGAGPIEPIPNGQALLDYWVEKLPTQAAVMLTHIATAHPVALSRAKLGELAGYSPNTGPFSTALATLRHLEIIEKRGDLKLTATFAEATGRAA